MASFQEFLSPLRGFLDMPGVFPGLRPGVYSATPPGLFGHVRVFSRDFVPG